VSRPELKRARADAGKVRAILKEDWQPIPGVPDDEWDSYVWPVLGLLQRKASREDVAAYLRRTADETVGVPVPASALDKAVDRLMALGIG
jgi:hypothetical protein